MDLFFWLFASERLIIVEATNFFFSWTQILVAIYLWIEENECITHKKEDYCKLTC